MKSQIFLTLKFLFIVIANVFKLRHLPSPTTVLCSSEVAKRELEQHVRPLCPLIREAILATPPEAVAKVAVHQRLRLDLPP